MSKKELENTEEKKILTRYDLKMQKKEEERKKTRRDEQVGRITGIVIVAALFCLVASFPLRSYLTINGAYIEVAGEKVTRVEFDYNYSVAKNNYIAQNSYYLSMFGIDFSGDLSAQMYSDTLSFQDYFEQLAVENIARNKALRDQMKEAGFTYDASGEYAQYEKTLEEAAKEAGVTKKAYLQQMYGLYATESRLKGYVRESMEAAAYYRQAADARTPSEADIQAYYEENTDDYDSVDYRIITVNAELPTEPTDLADPKEEGQETEEAGTDTAYKPSEAEVAFAMEKAKAEADAALKDIAGKGELKENKTISEVPSQTSGWLFDSVRKAGDTTVIENTVANLYYAVEFKGRRLDQTPTADARIIAVDAGAEVSADAILEEWKSGDRTQESFAALADKYGALAEGGLYEGLSRKSMTEDLAGWLFDGARVSGETAVISGAAGGDAAGSGTSYVVCYVGQNRPEWVLNIEATLLSERMSAYIKEITAGYEVTNGKGRLKYLTVQEEAAASGQESTESGESAESEASGSNQ